MIGRFLEISVYTPAIRESLEFYESLGFVQAQVAETWPHPYAVVTDGRAFVGLHAAPIPSPTLTFVLPRLQRAAGQLKQSGVHFEEEQFGEHVFNRASLRDPAGQWVRLLEARTFSPAALDASSSTACGYFTEFGMPAREPGAVCAFWEPLGFVALQEQSHPFARTALTSAGLNLAVYRTRALRHPVLTFEDRQMDARLSALRERGFDITDEMPDSLDESANGVLIAPEGTRLLLMRSEE
jgi:catechol 2,3-dioxygenase-like lactoylglutathione lyase family enzyme